LKTLDDFKDINEYNLKLIVIYILDIVAYG